MDFASYFPIWDKLKSDEQKLLKNSAIFCNIGKGNIIHNDLADSSGLLLVASGQLRAYILSDDGKEITIYRLFEHDLCLFSASCMMNSIQFDITISAEKDSGLWLIPSDVYKKLLTSSTVLANYTNEIMASRLSDVMWLMEQVLWKSFNKRLAEFLLNESKLENTNKLQITHEAIGNHMGNPREVVTRMLKYFQSEGMVKLKRGFIELIDKDKLATVLT